MATDLHALLWMQEEIIERGKRKYTLNNNKNKENV
jgi:hypothetical protein